MRYLFLCVLLLAGCQQPQKTATEEAVEFVRSEADYLAKTTDDFRFYAAVSAMNYIQTNISSVRNSLAHSKPDYTPPAGTEFCLVAGRGSCGNHVEAFIDILKALNVPVRPVQVYYENNGQRLSHIVAEVEWSGRWHMFDVTFGFIPHNGHPFEALSYMEARQRGTVEGEHNYINTHRIVLREDISTFDYLTMGDVVIDGTGTIHPPLLGNKFSFSHIPNYIGKTKIQNGSIGEMSMQVAQGSVTITPSAIACETGYLTSGDTSVPITSEPMTINVKGPISIKSDAEICYVVIKEMATGIS